MSHIIFPKSIKILGLVIILLLSIYNLFSFSKTWVQSPQIKGVATENPDGYEITLWQKFLQKYPNYLPGIKRLNELKNN